MVILILYKIYSPNLRHLETGEGFFKDWPKRPSQEKHKTILEKSYKSLIAVDEKTTK